MITILPKGGKGMALTPIYKKKIIDFLYSYIYLFINVSQP